ncbi:hypothetical protein F8S13_19650 [Chloroflexia bacterium SDU3-3]|nr:hypothetical protein F8S13_19650 [Chloroflexia bacterium SDU3-3]
MEIDTSTPNAGRIYDYFLGGTNNFEADRVAAEQLLRLMPSSRSGARLNRWFMYDAAARLADTGLGCLIDLASGLPTVGYIHDLVPTARVLYNDHDPVIVAYGREIIGDNPLVRYIQSNLTDIAGILDAADEHFGGERRVGISFIGVAYFFDLPVLRDILGALYRWCAPGSKLAISWLAGEPADVARFASSSFAAMYRQLGSPVQPRTLDEVRELLGPWQIEQPGIIPLSEWNGVAQWRGDEAGQEESPLDLYGVIVTKV